MLTWSQRVGCATRVTPAVASRHEAGSPKIALAAPTGKAAQRLSQAIRDGKAGLENRLTSDTSEQNADWRKALTSIPENAQTLHRLLGANPAADQFGYGIEQPLGYDIVVVDEASMVDLATMRALLDALRPATTLILVGDPDQLVSVSAGSVFADIVHASGNDPDGLARCAGHLTHVWRTGSELAKVYESARLGDLHSLTESLSKVENCTRSSVSNVRELQTHVERWTQRPEWRALHSRAQVECITDVPSAFKVLRSLQLLSALRAGPFGSDMINDTIDAAIRRQFGATDWYPGRPVVIRHNDYVRRLFNGDVGLTCRINGKLCVCFETVDAEGQLHTRQISPRELPSHDLGYALSVHKSQGSEYDHVAILLPPDSEHRILSRQLIYTAISRAKQSLELWSTEASLQAALTRLNVRRGGLRARLGLGQVGN